MMEMRMKDEIDARGLLRSFAASSSMQEHKEDRSHVTD